MILSPHPNILIVGDTGDGKSALCGELAEHIYKTQKKKTRLYNCDRGWETLGVYIELGIIEAVPLEGNPLLWANHAVQGHVKRNDKWVQDYKAPDGTEVGLYLFESMTALGEAFLAHFSDMARDGVNIGGGGAHNFTVSQPGEQSIKYGSNNMTHYGVTQERVVAEVKRSQDLPGTVVWTASTKRGEGQDKTPLIGPIVVGKALSEQIPRWFKYTFRVNAIPSTSGEPEHVLFLEDHKDTTAGGAKGLGNARLPLAGASVKVPYKISPASIVQALEAISKRRDTAKSDIKKRLGL